MKKTLVYILLFTCTLSFAQNRNGNEPRMNQKRMNAAKVAFLTERLNLDTKTAQAFWPIYNEYEAAKDELNKTYMFTMREEIGIENPRRGIDNISQNQAEQLIQITFEKREKEFTLEKEYLKKVASVLTAKQTLIVSQFDAEFRRTLMKRYSDEVRSQKGKQNKGN